MPKKPAIIFDIDGVLADCKHRLPLLPNYQAFHDQIPNDAPIGPIVGLGRHISAGYGYVILCTGRPDSHRIETVQWLHDNSVGYHSLYMRRASDHRKDFLVKEEMLREIEKEYNVQLVIEDRPACVEMWRRNGIVCLQNEYHEKLKFTCKPGELTVMVGPSGAGKDRWITGNASNTVISTDRLRFMLCGDLKDQSKNDQVFTVFHANIKTYIENGIGIVANATNIKNAARKEILALVPADTKITYIVLNRYMSDKIRTGGWRNEVTVKGVPLMEYHEQVFNANIRSILRGDDDPRVTVRDLRMFK